MRKLSAIVFLLLADHQRIDPIGGTATPMDNLEYIRDLRLPNGESTAKSNRSQSGKVDRSVSPIGLLDSVRDSALGGGRSRSNAHASSNAAPTCDSEYAEAASKAACR